MVTTNGDPRTESPKQWEARPRVALTIHKIMKPLGQLAVGALFLGLVLVPLPRIAKAQAAGDYLAGRHADMQNDITQAANFYERALARDPENVELLRRAFSFLASSGQLSKAVPLAQQLYGQDPANATALTVLVVDDLKRGKVSLAQSFLDSLPDSGVAQLVGPPLKAWVAMAASNREKALLALQPLDKLQGASALRDLHAGMINDLAGEVVAANTAYQALLGDRERISFRSALVIGNFFERSGKAAQARALYQDQTTQQSDGNLFEPAFARLDRGEMPKPLIASPLDGLAESLFHLATIFRQQRANDVALIFAELALHLRPDLNVANMLAGEIHQTEGRSQAAIKAFRRIDEKSPLGWTALLQIAGELAQIGKVDEAEWVLKTLAANRTDRFEPLVRLGNLLRSEERYAQAAEAYSKALERIATPERRHWSIYYFRGIAYEQSDQWSNAEVDFLKALELEPGQPNVLNYLAYSWVELRINLDRAEEMLKQAVAARPSDGYIVDSLGWIYYRLGRFEEAADRLERAVELRPQDPTINDHLGDAYWQVGRKREARFQWIRALGLQDDEEQRVIIEQKLETGLTDSPKDI